VVIPAYPGALSALGILISDVVKDHSRTVLLRVQPSHPITRKPRVMGTPGSEVEGAALPAKTLDAIFAELLRAIASELKKEEWQGRVLYEASCDVRYRGQGYELNLRYGSDLLSRFHADHKRRYGYSSPEREVEIVTVRLRGRVASPEKLSRMKIQAGEGKLKPAIATVFFGGKRHKAQVVPRELVRPGRGYRGPAIITEYSATTVIPPGFKFKADKAATLLVEVVQGKEGALL
jgi:N-methylhydantoinase A